MLPTIHRYSTHDPIESHSSIMLSIESSSALMILQNQPPSLHANHTIRWEDQRGSQAILTPTGNAITFNTWYFVCCQQDGWYC